MREARHRAGQEPAEVLALGGDGRPSRRASGRRRGPPDEGVSSASACERLVGLLAGALRRRSQVPRQLDARLLISAIREHRSRLTRSRRTWRRPGRPGMLEGTGRRQPASRPPPRGCALMGRVPVVAIRVVVTITEGCATRMTDTSRGRLVDIPCQNASVCRWPRSPHIRCRGSRVDGLQLARTDVEAAPNSPLGGADLPIRGRASSGSVGSWISPSHRRADHRSTRRPSGDRAGDQAAVASTIVGMGVGPASGRGRAHRAATCSAHAHVSRSLV